MNNLISSSTVPIPAIPNFSTKTFATLGDKSQVVLVLDVCFSPRCMNTVVYSRCSARTSVRCRSSGLAHWATCCSCSRFSAAARPGHHPFAATGLAARPIAAAGRLDHAVLHRAAHRAAGRSHFDQFPGTDAGHAAGGADARRKNPAPAGWWSCWSASRAC